MLNLVNIFTQNERGISTNMRFSVILWEYKRYVKIWFLICFMYKIHLIIVNEKIKHFVHMNQNYLIKKVNPIFSSLFLTYVPNSSLIQLDEAEKSAAILRDISRAHNCVFKNVEKDSERIKYSPCILWKTHMYCAKDGTCY